ncbi:MAG: hypothetical protein ACOC91_03215 [bacterium]
MHQEFLETARALAGTARRKPRQAELRRAVSTAYYAMFHALCEMCANALNGTRSPDRCERAWVQTYRALEHNLAAEACGRCVRGSSKGNNYKLPKPVRDFAAYFVSMQEHRYRADYSPSAVNYKRDQVVGLIDGAEKAIKRLRTTPRKHKAAFAALLLFKERNI